MWKNLTQSDVSFVLFESVIKTNLSRSVFFACVTCLSLTLAPKLSMKTGI